jgi:hypothetical protein
MHIIDDEWRKLNLYFNSETVNLYKNKIVYFFWLDLHV